MQTISPKPQTIKSIALGIDVGSNSLGWAITKTKKGHTQSIIDMGVIIFQRAVQDKSPTPKNVKRREARLARRTIQRKARRKTKMRNYLILNKLLPASLKNNPNPEIALNKIGDTYKLRTKALNHQLNNFELGRILLHFANYRGFQSNKKTLAGDLIEDADTIAYLHLNDTGDTKEEKGYLGEIAELRDKIEISDYRTLGEYLYNLPLGHVKRNRSHGDGDLRTDRDMYKYELKKIWQTQQKFFKSLPNDFIDEIKNIIFKQRPVTWDRNTIGNCSLETKKRRCHKSHPSYQEFQALKDINDLTYFEIHNDTDVRLSSDQKLTLRDSLFDKKSLNKYNQLSWASIKTLLSLKKYNTLNLETTPKNGISSISTYINFSKILGTTWQHFTDEQKLKFYEDINSIEKKSALKRRLISHYSLHPNTAIELAIMEFKPEYASLSLKAINCLLPYMRKGLSETEARHECGYYEKTNTVFTHHIPKPPFIPNPIVMKSLYQLKTLVNAIIDKYGIPGTIRIEMARDLEMNTKRYKENQKFQKSQQILNDEARELYKQIHEIYPPKGNDAVVRYKLWKQQDERCIYSGKSINQEKLFSADCEVDHIMPFSQTLNDSFFNKTLCFTAENRNKSNCTPIDAWNHTPKWDAISQMLNSLIDKYHYPKAKADLFRTKDKDLPKDFLGSQLSDTRYIAKEAMKYLKTLGVKVETTKGHVVSNIRYQWGFNSILGTTHQKEREDHRHHIIDAVVIASTTPDMYTSSALNIKTNHDKFIVPPPYPDIRNELSSKLNNIIVCHRPNNKITGHLHEETGSGYIKKHAGLVYRKILNPKFLSTSGGKFTLKNANKIVDETLKEIILDHISKHKPSKGAFDSGFTLYHKDGRTPIKRIRIRQSEIKTTKKKNATTILAETKKPIIDRSGKIFKYMSFGNINHVEVIKKDDKMFGHFVTVDEASRMKSNYINNTKKSGFKFSLVVNDTISLLDERINKRTYYRIQKLRFSSKNITV
jgi:CRISPR-associated endonuclease Csn1